MFYSDEAKNEFIYYLKESLGFNYNDIYLNSERFLTEQEENLIKDFKKKKEEGMPLDYILNSSKFYENDFYIDDRVLIPRPETEILVEYVNNHFSSTLKLLDVGTGSGCIGISIALKNLSATVYGSDNSIGALEVASINKRNLNADNFLLIHANWLSCFGNKSFDLIVSNPPYIDENDEHLNDLKHEPYGALVAKDHGLGDIKKIVSQSTSILREGGVLMIEHGHDQESEVKNIFSTSNFSNILCLKDLSSIPRITIGTLKI